MAEILTESFCERCGSRYTFESAVPRARLRGVKVLSRGLKNFVLDDKTSIDEAMAAARDDTDRSLTSQQLEAFHKTFNFCMECRQYICPNCWNEGEGRCLTCAPTLGRGILPSPFPNLDPSVGIVAAPDDGLAAAAMNGHTHVADETNGNGFDSIGRLETLTQATAPAAPVEMIGGEVQAQTPVEPDAVAPATDEPGVDAVDAEAAAPASLDAPVAQPEAERFIYDPYDPPPPAPPAPIVDEAVAAPREPEIIGEEPVAAEPAAVAEPGAVEETIAAQDVVTAQDVAAEAGTEPSSDEAEAGSDRAAALAAPTSLVLAGLRPGESLDEALAAFEAEPMEDEATDGVAAETVVAAEESAAPASIEHPLADAAVIAALASTPAEAETPIASDAAEPTAPDPAVLAAAAAVLAAATHVADTPVAPAPVADASRVDEPVEAQAEPVATVEPLDEIQVEDSVAFETAAAAQPEAEPEPAWQAEPLDDIVPVEAVEVAPEPVAEAVVFDEAVVDVAPGPVAVEAAPEPAAVETVPEPVAVEAAPEPAAVEAAPEPVAPAVPESAEIAAAATADDIVAQPTWSILAPDPQPVTEVPGPLADGPAPIVEPLAPAAQAAPPASSEPTWPAQPQWPNAQTSSGLPFLGRHAVPTGGVDALWAESNQAVSAPRTDADKPAGGVQPCTSCGLSLSASARFCRRCGTSQVG